MSESIITARTQTGDEIPAFIGPDGVIRFLGLQPGDGLMRFKALPLSAAYPVIPRSDWFPIDRHRDEVETKDQAQEGSCVANGWDTIIERIMVAAGMKHTPLSRAMLYAFINGGRDAGANPADAANIASTIGMCTEALCPYRFLVESQITQAMREEAKRFRLEPDSIYECNSFDELVTAELMGFKTGMTVRAGGGFVNLDSDGAPPVYRGMGNHWMSCDTRLKKAPNGEWLLGAIQSWGTGVWNRGLGYFRAGHWDNQNGAQGFAVKWAGWDPLDPNIAPIAR